MEKPLALKVISIILIVLGILRLLSGVGGYILLGFGNMNDTIAIFIDNFVCGVLILISGLMLLTGNKTGRILLIPAFIIPPVANIILLKILGRGFIIFVILILFLYLWPSIKKYFNRMKEL